MPVSHLPLGRRGVGIVFQDYAVFTRMSVRENLSFGLEAQGVDRATRASRVAQAASPVIPAAISSATCAGVRPLVATARSACA